MATAKVSTLGYKKKFEWICLAPAGIVPTINPTGSGAVYTLGNNLPAVDPNNYAGTVHFGQPTTTVGQGYGQYAAGGGFSAAGPGFPAANANLNAGANFYGGV